MKNEQLTALVEVLRSVLVERSDLDLADISEREAVVDDLTHSVMRWYNDWTTLDHAAQLAAIRYVRALAAKELKDQAPDAGVVDAVLVELEGSV